MVDVVVTFRGLHCLILDQKKKAARVFFPSTYRSSAAQGNEYQTIPCSYPFVAVPLDSLDQQRSLAPDFITGFRLATENHQAPDRPLQLRGAYRTDVVLASERLMLRASEERVFYAIYFLDGRKVEIEPLQARKGLTWVDVPLNLPNPPKNSIRWLPELEGISGGAIRSKNALSQPDPPTDTGSFLDIDTGMLEPILHVVPGNAGPHQWRFLHSTSMDCREMADSSKVTVPAPKNGSFTITLSTIEDSDRIIVNSGTKTCQIFVGNEALDDLLAVGRGAACAEPAFHFETIYTLCDVYPYEDYGRRLPVPFCIAQHKPDPDRDPPGAMCGPGVIIRG
ncbi:MAG TPA: hypothetical protein VGF69_13325 [Thermoanaerobaculia bacterium]|jgi:hypothetical protein